MMNNPDSIFFYHLRKSGGTTLRHLLGQHCKSESIDFKVIEGWSLCEHNSLPDDIGCFTLTCVRHPIDRLKSSYRFEGRWEQQAEVRLPETALSFEAWVEQTAAMAPSSKLWQCVENYTIKSLIGYPLRGESELGEDELKIAMEVLESFDLVLITEHLSHQATADLLNHHLGITTPVPHRVYPTRAPNPTEQDEALFDPGTMKRVIEANELDFRLYVFAINLYLKQVDEW